MKNTEYLIGVLRVRGYNGIGLSEYLSEEDRYYEYAGYDDQGNYASGYPCMHSSHIYAKKFDSPRQAVEFYSEHYKVLIQNPEDYDLSDIKIFKNELMVYDTLSNADIFGPEYNLKLTLDTKEHDEEFQKLLKRYQIEYLFDAPLTGRTYYFSDETDYEFASILLRKVMNKEE